MPKSFGSLMRKSQPVPVAPQLERGTAHERGYTYRWRRYAAQYRKEHPLCVMCEKEGRITPSFCVDHKLPHRGDPVLFWDPANHQALCKPCHDRKTASEDGGFGNPSR